MGKTIIWTHQADAELNEAFLDLFDQTQSIGLTAKIITEIYESTSILATDPEIYKLDTLKHNNKGNIRLSKNIPIEYPILSKMNLCIFFVCDMPEKSLWNIKLLTVKYASTLGNQKKN